MTVAAPKVAKFPIVEVFGPTIQGEGVLAGHQTMFIRFGYCDYKCVWCDSLHAVDPKQVKENATYLDATEIAELIRSEEIRVGREGNVTPWITLSGGNPAMHKNMDQLIDLLHQQGYKIAIETQGTIMHDWMYSVDVVTVSPKPPSSGMTDKFFSDQGQEQFRKYIDLVDMIESQVILKIVVFNDDDYEHAKMVHLETKDKVPMYLSVGNLVGDDSTQSLLDKYAWLVDKLLADPDMRDTIPLPQLHVLIWGNRQGV